MSGQSTWLSYKSQVRIADKLGQPGACFELGMVKVSWERVRLHFHMLCSAKDTEGL